jgi:hypothetical protein
VSSQVKLYQNSFYLTAAKIGGAIYYQIVTLVRIFQSFFVETKAEKGCSIYFTGGKEEIIPWIYCQFNHFHKNQTPFELEGAKEDASISGDLDFSTQFAYDFVSSNFTSSEKWQTKGDGYAVYISVQSPHHLVILYCQFQGVNSSQLIYILSHKLLKRRFSVEILCF